MLSCLSWSRSFPFLLAAASAVACGAEPQDAESSDSAAHASGATLLDVNDVSILFPFQGREFFPQIPVAQGDLWTQENFDLVMKAAKLSTIEAKSQDEGYPLREQDRAGWRIVSLRFDPCAPGISAVRADVSGARFQHNCHVQLRLVAEPKARTLAAPSDDFAAHLIYDLATVPVDTVATDPLVRGIVDRLVAIKRIGARDGQSLDVTSGALLGPHPKLARRDAAAKRAAGAIQRLIFDVTRGTIASGAAPRPVQRSVAFMGLRKDGEEWVFLTGKMNEQGRWEQAPRLPTLPAPIKNEFTNPNGVAFQALTSTFEIVDGPEPKPEHAVASTTPFFSGEGTAESQAQLFQLENPATGYVFNTDCVSCHTSSPAKAQVRVLAATEAERSARMKVPAFVTGYIAPSALQKKDYNVHAFSTFFQPSVSGRTLNETVEVVSYLNNEVLQDGVAEKHPGPGLSCADDLAVQLCLMADDAQDCLAGCRKAE